MLFLQEALSIGDVIGSGHNLGSVPSNNSATTKKNRPGKPLASEKDEAPKAKYQECVGRTHRTQCRHGYRQQRNDPEECANTKFHTFSLMEIRGGHPPLAL